MLLVNPELVGGLYIFRVVRLNSVNGITVENNYKRKNILLISEKQSVKSFSVLGYQFSVLGLLKSEN
jgi:hypothetical protein